MADGWTELGAGLAGGWGDGREAFVKQMKLHGDAGQSLAKAARARSMAMAHANITPEAMQALMTGGEGQYATMAAIAAASASPDLRRLGDFQRPQYAALELERQDAMRRGDFKRMNAITSALGDDQHEPYSVEGAGKLVFDPVTGQAAPTVLGTSAMEVDAARANQANARAGVSNVQAAAGGWKPSTAGGGGKPPKFTAPSSATLKATLGGDSDKMAEFRGWQAQQAAVDPAYNNGDFALAQFLSGDDDARTVNFGLGGDVALPASVSPDAIQIVMAENRDRGARGLPPLTREEQIAMVQQHMAGGEVRAPVLGGGSVPAPRPPGGIATVPAGPGLPGIASASPQRSSAGAPKLPPAQWATAIQQANAAIEAGADPDAVRQRLLEMGVQLAD